MTIRTRGNPKWTKGGPSPNPGGRPKVIRAVQVAAREHTEEAIDTLVTIMGDEKAHDSARVSAANAILDRGWGRAAQVVESVAIEDMTEEELNEELARSLENLPSPLADYLSAEFKFFDPKTDVSDKIQ
jgi:hypothetical protein